jgi:hypothetical protein
VAVAVAQVVAGSGCGDPLKSGGGKGGELGGGGHVSNATECCARNTDNWF